MLNFIATYRPDIVMAHVMVFGGLAIEMIGYVLWRNSEAMLTAPLKGAVGFAILSLGFFIAISGMRSQAIPMPVMSVYGTMGFLVMATFVSLFWYKDVLTIGQWVSVALGIAAVLASQAEGLIKIINDSTV